MIDRRSDEASLPRTTHGLHEVASDPGALDEEFLYHLSRGSEFLIANRVVEAKEELEKALSYRPLDARSQDLLASVYFRLGVYPRAIEIWQNLVTTHGDDVALRVNLGLALLKTAQPELALTQLARAVARDPHHERAWRYVGLAEWRMGNLDRAREAFLRGGQASMARRMEEMLGSSSGQVNGQEATPFIDSRLSLAPSAIRPPSDDAQDPVVIAGASATSPSLQPAPLPSMAPADLAPEAPSRERRPPSVAPRASVRPEPAHEERELFALTHDGQLIATPHRSIASRRSGLRVLVGRPADEPIRRRVRGVAQDDAPPLGEQDPLYRFCGQRALHFAPPPSERFELRRVSGDALFVVERSLFAFDGALEHESGVLPGSAAGVGPSAQIVQLRGQGLVVLRVERALRTLQIEETDEVQVLQAALVGWSGHIFPSADDERWVVLRGSGTVHVA